MGIDSDKISEYTVGNEYNQYSVIVKSGNKVWVFPGFGDDIYTIDCNELHVFHNYDVEFTYYASPEWYAVGCKYINYIETDKSFVFPLRVGTKMCVINKDNEQLNWITVDKPPSEVRMRVSLSRDSLIHEVRAGDLHNYIDIVNNYGQGN